jgi:hypothetical protein
MQRVKVKIGVKQFIKAILENKSDFLLSDPEGVKGGRNSPNQGSGHAFDKINRGLGAANSKVEHL